MLWNARNQSLKDREKEQEIEKMKKETLSKLERYSTLKI